MALALFDAGRRVVVVDRPLPTALRLRVAFAAAAVEGSVRVQGVEAVHCLSRREVLAAWDAGQVPLWTGDETDLGLKPAVVIDVRMRSLSEPRSGIDDARLVIGVGPGFTAGVDAHYVIESNRGPRLGRVIAQGAAEPSTGVPGAVEGFRRERLLVAPCAGTFQRVRDLGDLVDPDDVVGHVAGQAVRAQIGGLVRGLKLSGVTVGVGHKVGDVDPRRDPALLEAMTDKALAVGRGVVLCLKSPPPHPS